MFVWFTCSLLDKRTLFFLWQIVAVRFSCSCWKRNSTRNCYTIHAWWFGDAVAYWWRRRASVESMLCEISMIAHRSHCARTVEICVNIWRNRCGGESVRAPAAVALIVQAVTSFEIYRTHIKCATGSVRKTMFSMCCVSAMSRQRIYNSQQSSAFCGVHRTKFCITALRLTVKASASARSRFSGVIKVFA